MTLKAVIFDMDGTLVDSVEAHARAWQEAFGKFGKTVPLEVMRRQIGKGGDKILPEFLTPDEQKQFGKQLKEFRAAWFRERYLPHIRPFPQVRPLFERLRADGLRVALASSSNPEDLKTYKRIANIEGLVEEETSKGDAKHSKPDPDIIAAALHRLDLPGPQTQYVGDTPYDAEAARKLEIPSIGVRSGGWSDAELKAGGCHAVFADIAELFAAYPFRTGVTGRV